MLSGLLVAEHAKLELHRGAYDAFWTTAIESLRVPAKYVRTQSLDILSSAAISMEREMATKYSLDAESFARALKLLYPIPIPVKVVTGRTPGPSSSTKSHTTSSSDATERGTEKSTMESSQEKSSATKIDYRLRHQPVAGDRLWHTAKLSWWTVAQSAPRGSYIGMVSDAGNDGAWIGPTGDLSWKMWRVPGEPGCPPDPKAQATVPDPNSAAELHKRFTEGDRVISETHATVAGTVVAPTAVYASLDGWEAERRPICIRWDASVRGCAYQWISLERWTPPPKQHTKFCSHSRCMCDDLERMDEAIAAEKDPGVDLSKLGPYTAASRESSYASGRPWDAIACDLRIECDRERQHLRYRPKPCNKAGCASTTGCMHPRSP
jgi:hypothetical protein